ncbi:tRNA wybutosine-synthesizing protein 4 isoform X1 [Oopsacas minuta]|uniref:tRNA wybutosine-synthesizing protein 4 n=1 Tax=Oopsacas minuta TaxID=111878 RepID=A0AAV7JD85_9METZ|nr:tRNA wybutosine-synthesizing protein 4 isoform X1 [Oopsacas minuta]
MSSIPPLSLLKPNAVQGTNDYSMVSKCSTCQAGYFADPFVKHFVSKLSRRAPIIHWGYYIRNRAIQHVLTSFCRWGRSSGVRTQIVVLGAGFDTAYLRLRSEGLVEGVTFVEVDFPLVMENKKRLLTASGYDGDGCYLLGQDLRDTKALLSKLRAIPDFDLLLPTLFVSEVVLTYMRPSQSSRLIKWAALNFPNLCFFIYEQVYTHDPFGLVMMHHYQSIGSLLYTAADYETPLEQETRFLHLAYEHVRSVDMNSFFYNHTSLLEDEVIRIQSLEPFDEYEEWHQKCNHYTVLLAGRAKGTEFIASLSPPSDPVSSHSTLSTLSPSYLTYQSLPHSALLLRHSHASCYNPVTESVFLFGGYGSGGIHGRVNSSAEVRLSFSGKSIDCKCVPVEIRGEGPGGLMHCTLSTLPDGSIVLVGGRKSPKAPNIHTYLLSLDCVSEEKQYFWNKLSLGDVTPEPRWRHSANTVVSESSVSLLIHGGVSLGGLVHSDTWLLDMSTHSWRLMLSKDSGYLAQVHSHTAVIWNDLLIVYGGLTRMLTPSSHLLMLPYKEISPVWNCVQFDPPLPARYSHSAVIKGSIIYSLGGVELHSPCYYHLLVINLDNRSWTDTNLCSLYSPLRSFLPYNFSAELVDKGRQLLVIGGGGNCFSFGTHFNPQPWLLGLTHT